MDITIVTVGNESDLVYHLIGTLKEAAVDGDKTISELTDVHMFQIVNDMFFGKSQFMII